MYKFGIINLRYHRSTWILVVLPMLFLTENEEQEGKTGCNNNCNCSESTSVQHLTDEEQFAVTILQEEANYNASAVKDNGRRTNYLSWNDYFMGVAFLTAQRSKDPNTQVGACIVDDEHRIIGLGCKLCREAYIVLVFSFVVKMNSNNTCYGSLPSSFVFFPFFKIKFR